MAMRFEEATSVTWDGNADEKMRTDMGSGDRILLLTR